MIAVAEQVDAHGLGLCFVKVQVLSAIWSKGRKAMRKIANFVFIGSSPILAYRGMAEWFKALVLKAKVCENAWVRIPVPLFFLVLA